MRIFIACLLLGSGSWIVGCGGELDGEGAPSGSVEAGYSYIIDGDIVPDGEYTATGALVLEGSLLCTATLIAPDVVVTAAHCLDEWIINEYGMPSFTLVKDVATAQISDIVEIDSVEPHPEFIFGEEEGLAHFNDIGYAILSKRITTGHEQVATASNVTALLAEDATLDIVGYGMTEASNGGVMFHAQTPLAGWNEWEIVTGRPGDPQPCYGDSGGPVYARLGESRYIIGIISRSAEFDGGGCDRGGIATRPDAYLEFLPKLPAPGGGENNEKHPIFACAVSAAPSTSGRSTPWVLLFAVVGALWVFCRREYRHNDV